MLVESITNVNVNVNSNVCVCVLTDSAAPEYQQMHAQQDALADDSRSGSCINKPN